MYYCTYFQMRMLMRNRENMTKTKQQEIWNIIFMKGLFVFFSELMKGSQFVQQEKEKIVRAAEDAQRFHDHHLTPA